MNASLLGLGPPIPLTASLSLLRISLKRDWGVKGREGHPGTKVLLLPPSSQRKVRIFSSLCLFKPLEPKSPLSRPGWQDLQTSGVILASWGFPAGIFPSNYCLSAQSVLSCFLPQPSQLLPRVTLSSYPGLHEPPDI